MSREGIFITNEAGEEVFVYYDELDEDAIQQLCKPIVGFCFDANTFKRMPLARVPFYVQDWLPKQGKVLIYGQAKAGKSYLAVQLARCVGSGLPFLGIPTMAGRVLYLQFELGAEVLQGRLKASRQDHKNVVVGTTFSLKLDTAPGKKTLYEMVEGVAPNVLILDPLYKTIRGEENESHDMLIICDLLDELMDAYSKQTGMSVVIMHHTGKDLSKGARGSSVLEDWADTVIEQRRISKQGEALRVRLTPKLMRHAASPPEPIEAELADSEFALRDPKKTIRDEVAEYLRGMQDISVSAKTIIDAGIGSQRSVYDALSELVVDGLVDKESRGSYRWIGG
jgi:KaiC/GvpD/RAD55 family RecA-like ATPase